MSNLVTVVWKGIDRVVPKFGMASRGNKLILPRDQAESFIAQGLAETQSKSASQIKGGKSKVEAA